MRYAALVSLFLLGVAAGAGGEKMRPSPPVTGGCSALTDRKCMQGEGQTSGAGDTTYWACNYYGLGV